VTEPDPPDDTGASPRAAESGSSQSRTDLGIPGGGHAIVETRHRLSAGDLVAGRYAIERRLGGGSMGDVFLAEDRLLKKPIALKVLRSDLAQNRDTVRRFHREVALAHSVTHRNVVRIYDTGEQNGLPFFTMELLQGEALDELLEGPSGNSLHGGERLSIRKIRTIAIDVLDAMDAAHRAGVVHRDLKPGNVMLTHRGAIVMDFGVAGIEESLERGRPNPSHESLRSLVHTEVGTIFGSPAYMAPELWEGEVATVQSDLYAFGVMLYQMLTGRLPFAAKTPAAYVERLNAGPPPSLRSLRRDTPWSLVRLVRRCMAKDPAARPPSAAAAANMISPLRSGQRRRAAIFGAIIAGIAIAVLAVQSRPRFARLGLSDALTEADLAASVRDLDAGELGAAARRLERISDRAPRSAAVRFWRALALHELGDETARLAMCDAAPARGSRWWIELADAACEPTFRIGDPIVDALDGEGIGPEVLPLAVEGDLLPRLAADPGDEALRELADRTLERLREPEHDVVTEWAMPVRTDLARIELLVALDRGSEAAEALDAMLADETPSPRLAARAARLALLSGDRRRAAALADIAAEVDPTPSVRLLLHDGRLDAAWARVQAEPSPHRRAGLTTLWCGYALRMAMTTRPPRCRDLPPGLVAALWDAAEGRMIDDTGLQPGDRAIVQRWLQVASGDCRGSPAGKDAIAIRWVDPPMELYGAELEVQAASCEAASGADVELARTLSRKLVALAPDDPWVQLVAADVDAKAPDAELAQAHRLAAAERWAAADDHLPLVAWLRERVAGGQAGPRPRTAQRVPEP
jgi:tRNA A-37 threonylcarbamoyl transferase component Bud32